MHPSAEFSGCVQVEIPAVYVSGQYIPHQKPSNSIHRLNIYLDAFAKKLRGGSDDSDDFAQTISRPAKTSSKKKKKRSLVDKLHHEAWRKLKPEDPLPDGLEIRKMTREGHHILRVGETFSKRGIKLKEAESKRLMRAKRGQKEREKAIEELEKNIKEQKSFGQLSSGKLPSKPVKELEAELQKLKFDLIRYKDDIYGTDVWKQMTEHTVPYSLRNIDQFKQGDDLLLYKALTETRSIVFNHHKASSAAPEVLTM